jgi:hypothetical protein
MQRFDALKQKPPRLTTDDVGMIFITLTVNGCQVFGFSLGESLFNRMGTGALQTSEQELCCGAVTRELFHRVAAGITADILRWKGIHMMPVQKGRRCELFMAILFKGGQEWTTRWHYGSVSEGPPPEIWGFMRRAIDLTDPRAEPQQEMTPGTTSSDGWHEPSEPPCAVVVPGSAGWS